MEKKSNEIRTKHNKLHVGNRAELKGCPVAKVTHKKKDDYMTSLEFTEGVYNQPIKMVTIYFQDHVAIIDRHTWNQAQMMLLGGEEARDKKEKKRRANNASPFTNLTYGVDGCNEPMFRIGYNTPLYTYTDERSAKAEP